jgi:multiple sugar transport system permease protein
MKRPVQAHHKHGKYNKLVFPARDMLWLIPGTAMFCLCYVIPYFVSLLSSFLSNAETPEFVGLENYRVLFSDGFYWLSLKNTLLYLFLAIELTLILGLFIAYAFFMLRHLQALVVLLLIPFFLPFASISALWRSMMGNSSQLVQFLHPRDASWKFLSLLLLFLWKNVGVATCLILVGRHGIDPSVLSAAELDGASKRQLLCKIELPLLRHVIIFSIIYLLMNGVRIFRESYLLYGGYPPANLFFVQHYINGYFARLDYSLLSSAAVVFSHIVLVLFYIAWSILHKGDCDEK